MSNLKKIFGSMLVGFLVLPMGLAMAGGSSISLKGEPTQGENAHVFVQPGDILDKVLTLEVKTYFLPDWDIENIRVEDIVIGCYDADLFSQADLILDNQVIDSNSFVLEGDFYRAYLGDGHLGSIDLQNNATYNFTFNLKVKKNAEASHVVECGVHSVTLINPDNNEVLFSGMQTGGFVNVEKNVPLYVILQ